MNVFDLMAKLSLDASDFESGLKRARNVAKTGMKVVGAAVTAAGGALVAFGKASIDTGRDFDSAMSQVAATLGFTGEAIKNNLEVNGEHAGTAFENLREKALQMGSETMYTAQQAAEGLNILSMAGFQSADSIGMIEDVLHLAAAGSMELSEAASYVSGSLKGFASEGKNAKYYSDLMAKGATLANTSVSQLGEALSGTAATASSYSQSSDSVTLALLRLANQNVVGSAAVTALNRAMADIYTPTDQAADALKALGVSAYETNGDARDFNDIIDDLNGALSGMTEEQKNATKATIFTAQGLSAFNKMTAASADDVEKWAGGIADATDSAAEQYATMTDNLEGDITALGSALDGLKISVSDNLTPAFRDFVQFGTKGIQDITNGFKSGGLNGAVEAFGTVLSDGIGMIVSKVPEFVSASGALVEAFVSGIVDNMPAVLDTAYDMFNKFVTGVLDKAPEMITTGAEMISKFITGLADEIPHIIPRVVLIVTTIGNALVDNAPLLVSAAGDLIKGIFDGIMTGIPKLLELGRNMITNIADGLRDNLPEVIDQALHMVQDFATMCAEQAPLLIEAGISFITNLVLGLVDALPTMIEQIPTIVSTFANIINDNAPTVLMAGFNLLVNVGKGLVQAIPTLIANIPQIIQAFIDVWQAFQWIDLGKNAITALKNGILKMKGAVTSAGQNILQAITNAIKNLPAKLMELGKGGITKIASALSNGVATVINAAKGILNGITGAFTSLPSKMLGIGKQLIQGLWNGISNMSAWVIDRIKSLGSSIISAVKGVFGIKSPSRVFKQIGEYCVEGFNLGIDDLKDVSSITDEIEDAMGAVKVGNGDYTVTVKNNTQQAQIDSMVEALTNMYRNMEIARGEMVNNIRTALDAFGIRIDEREVARLIKKYA